MTFAFRLQMFAGTAAATLCLALMASNEAAAQIFPQRATTHGYYNPYGARFNTGYFGGRGYGYSGFGQGRYGVGLPGGYAYPPSGAYRHGTYYGGGSFRQRRAFGQPRFGRGSLFYSPFGYGRRF